jgi:hypothetical protein
MGTDPSFTLAVIKRGAGRKHRVTHAKCEVKVPHPPFNPLALGYIPDATTVIAQYHYRPCPFGGV